MPWVTGMKHDQYNETDQDKLEDLLTITEQEMTFWNNMDISPTYMFEEFGVVDEYCMDESDKILNNEQT